MQSFKAQFDSRGQTRLRCVKRLELGQIVSPETAKEAARKAIFDQNQSWGKVNPEQKWEKINPGKSQP